MPNEIIDETESQAQGTPETPQSDNPLDALIETKTPANTIEIADDAQYKLANGNIVTGKDLANIQKGFTQATQKSAQQIKELQDQLAIQQRETTALRDYLAALNVTTQTPAQPNTDTGAFDYNSYNNQPPQQPAVQAIDPNKIAQVVETRVLQAVQNERLAMEKRVKEEAELRAKEEEWARKYPNIPLKDFVYKAQAAVDNSDYDTLMEEHLKLNKVLNAQLDKNRQQKAEQARQAYMSGVTSGGVASSATNNNNSGKRLTQSAMKDKIKQASKKAKEDMKYLNSA